ncbi:MAG: hypothetical protein WEA09_00705 [Gemmatimonadota bacterium]
MTNHQEGEAMKTGGEGYGGPGQHPEDELLHDYAEGSSAEADVHRVEAHLEHCLECRASVEWVRQLRTAARELPKTVPPPSSQWAAVRNRIRAESPVLGRVVGTVGPAAPLPRSLPGDRRVHLPSPRKSKGWMLAAAAVALVALSSATTLWVATGVGLDPAGGLAGAPGGLPVTGVAGVVQASRVVGEMESGYGPAVQELESILQEASDVLAPETVRALEESLAAIDLAIQEAREAILADPGAAGLVEVLNGHYEWKVQLLRQVADLVQAT